MSSMPPLPQRRVALLIDCDNVSPDIVPFALERARGYGKVVARRGYGNHTTLANKWKDAMLQEAVAPHLHFCAVSGKNTSDIALALDGFALAVDGAIDAVCVVTSDADFIYLCTKLRERGILCCVVGMDKTPAALRVAADYFHEFRTPAPTPERVVANDIEAAHTFLTRVVRRVLMAEKLERVQLTKIGQYLHTNHPNFLYKELGKTLAAVPMLECESNTVRLRQ